MIITAEVIVVGAGLAGMTAACSASEQGAAVVLVDRGAIGTGTNSAMSNGRFAGPTPVYSPERFVSDTLETGRGINLKPMVEQTAVEAPAAFAWLRSMGLELEAFADYYFYKSPRLDVMRGTSLVRAFAHKLRSLERLRRLTGFYVTDILFAAGGVCGVNGFDDSGRRSCIAAPSVVLATGGAGAVYLRNDNQKSMLGQGYFLAAQAGLELWDMEFVQFYPLVLAEPRMPAVMMYPPYPQEIRLLNAAGENIIEKYGDHSLNEAMRKKRDHFSEIILSESASGPVKLDCRTVPGDLWDAYPLSLLRKIKFDFRRRPVSVLPGAHFFMGGVRTAPDGSTRQPGLFACGEAVWGLHGANRMSGNALTECIVFGRTAGRSAAAYARSRGAAPASPSFRRLPAAGPSPAPEDMRLSALRRSLREIAWKFAGVARDTDGMRSGLCELEGVSERLRRLAPQGINERKQQADLIAGAFAVKAVLTAGLGRRESRGAFIHREYPGSDDVRWRRNSCLTYHPGTDRFSLKYVAVDGGEE